MASQEIHSFVEKFHQLWNAGFSAHLDVDTHAGEAWVGLRVNLGHARGGHQPEQGHLASFYPKQESSSRQRRRARRAAARSVQENESKVSTVEAVPVEAANNNVAENDEENSNENESSTDNEICEKQIASEEEAPDVIENKAEGAAVEAVQTRNETILDENVDDADVKNVVDGVVASEVIESSDRKDDLIDKTANLATKQLSEDLVPVRPTVETVFATAVISHSFSSKVTESDIDYLLRIIKSKEHLNHNIISVELGSVRSYKEKGDKFEHEVQVMIKVKTVNLWESSRSYLYHHLGKDIWNLRDGTDICLRRIHHKR